MTKDQVNSKRPRGEDDVEITQPVQPAPLPTSKYRYAMICSSNINRSMEAHAVLQNAAFDTESYGVGKQLRLPGPEGVPRCFEFGTPYAEIAQCLGDEAPAHYHRIGVLGLAQRAARCKDAPQRWQDAPVASLHALDVVFVFETRLFEEVLFDARDRSLRSSGEAGAQFQPLHLVCVDTRDSPKDAVDQGARVLKLCQQIEAVDLNYAMPLELLAMADRGELQYSLVYI